MDPDTFLRQLALVLAQDGPTTVSKTGAYVVLQSHGRSPQRVVIPQSQVPWLRAMYNQYRRP